MMEQALKVIGELRKRLAVLRKSPVIGSLDEVIICLLERQIFDSIKIVAEGFGITEALAANELSITEEATGSYLSQAELEYLGHQLTAIRPLLARLTQLEKAVGEASRAASYAESMHTRF